MERGRRGDGEEKEELEEGEGERKTGKRRKECEEEMQKGVWRGDGGRSVMGRRWKGGQVEKGGGKDEEGIEEK